MVTKKRRRKVVEKSFYNKLNMEEPKSPEDIKLNSFFYGLTGTGKTWLLGSAAKCKATYPMFFIAIDPGELTLAGIPKERMEILKPNTFAEIQDAYDFLRFENTKFKSIGLDSTTEMHDKLSMGKILDVVQEDGSYGNLETSVPATQYDWLQSGEQMKRNIRAFRDLASLREVDRRLHVFMTALEKTDEKRNVVCPALPGALGVSVGAHVDILGRLSWARIKRNDEIIEVRKLDLKQIESEGYTYLGKARSPMEIKLPVKIYNPTVAKLIKLWMAK